MRHRDHLHHRPRVWRARGRYFKANWYTACPCGWVGSGATQHIAFIRALAHAEGNLR